MKKNNSITERHIEGKTSDTGVNLGRRDFLTKSAFLGAAAGTVGIGLNPRPAVAKDGSGELKRDICCRPIGIIHTPFTSIKGMPIQPSGGVGVRGTIELSPEFAPGLKDVSGFSHLILLYHFHLSNSYDLEVKPFLDDTPRGVFATRAPRRPNSIGLSVVKLVGVDGCTLHIENLDIVDGTPLLDIKPFVSAFDHVIDERNGWLDQIAKKARGAKSDERFR